MNSKDRKKPLSEIVFLIDENSAGASMAEAEEACRYLQDHGYRTGIHPVKNTGEAQRETAGAAIQLPVLSAGESEGVLYITDMETLCGKLAHRGYAAAGYLHAGNAGSAFRGTDWIISEPAYVDIDSYVKIYQRIKGIPWTILTTRRCIVREMETADLDALYRLYEDPAASAFLEGPDPDREAERKRLSEYIEKIYGFYGYGYWMIEEIGSGEVIGRVGFAVQKAGMKHVQFGYLIRADKRRQGYALEVTQAVLRYAQDNLDLPGIGAAAAEDNLASVRLLKRLGFHEDGRTDAGEIRFVL